METEYACCSVNKKRVEDERTRKSSKSFVSPRRHETLPFYQERLQEVDADTYTT